MLIKFFRNPKHAGSRSGLSAIDYLLNERVEQGTSRILAGNEALTRSIIKETPSKNKATCCCLSFEEADINEADKMQIIDDFFNTMLPELEGRYNSLVVEHTDKGRLELNIVIPNIDIQSQTIFTPYFHARDGLRCDMWTQKINLQYGFSDPHDPAKKNTISNFKGGSANENAEYEELDKRLYALALDGVIKDKTRLIEMLTNSGIEVKRNGKDYISVKLPNSKKPRRFKGGIYNDEFGVSKGIREIGAAAAAEIDRYRERDRNAEIESINRKLNENIRYAAKRNRERCEKDDARAAKRRSRNDEIAKESAASICRNNANFDNRDNHNRDDHTEVKDTNNDGNREEFIQSIMQRITSIERERSREFEEIENSSLRNFEATAGEMRQSFEATANTIRRKFEDATDAMRRRITEAAGKIRQIGSSIQYTMESVRDRLKKLKESDSFFKPFKSREATIAPKDISEPIPTTQNAPMQSKNAPKQGILKYRGSEYEAELLQDQFGYAVYHLLKSDSYVNTGTFIPYTTPTPTQTKTQQPKTKPGIDYGRE